MTITTHDQHAAQFVQDYGSTPKPSKEKVAAFNKRRAESARRAKAERAAATGPRADEHTVLPPGHTSGATNPEARGCVPIEWKPPVGGKWVAGPNGVERFVPDPAPACTPTVAKPAPEPVPVKPQYEGWLTGTSAIGAKTANPFAASPCGPAPVAWVDSAEIERQA
jgi:hypothetical protein